MKKNTKINIIMGVALGQLILAVAVMIYGTFKKTITNSQSNGLIGVSLFLYWFLADVAEPFLMKRLDGISAERKSAYLKYILFDFIGLAGIAYFLLGMGNAGNSSLIGAVIYVVTVRLKRDNQDIFYGIKKAQEEETGAEEADVEPESSPEEAGTALEDGAEEAEAESESSPAEVAEPGSGEEEAGAVLEDGAKSDE
ncbi:MAG: hypothetical protein Q4C50_02380 [Eubacteriales bacterium]|nr:hypothetical protein [Eubacteriales bacterium]